jgi:hypothetical protein
MINKQKMGKSGRGPSKEINCGAGRDGNGVQSNDGRSNLGSGENAGQPKDPGPGAGQVKQDTA